jgi:hypothetical protein
VSCLNSSSVLHVTQLWTVQLNMPFPVVVLTLNVESVLKSEEEILIRNHKENFFVACISGPVFPLLLNLFLFSYFIPF